MSGETHGGQPRFDWSVVRHGTESGWSLHQKRGEWPRRDRPEAHVRFFANPCGSRECQGSLLCVGHHACVECIAAIRADKCKWGPGALAGADIELYGITSGGIR